MMFTKNEVYWNRQKIVLTSGHQDINSACSSEVSSVDSSDDECTVKRQRLEDSVSLEPRLLWHVKNRKDYFPLALNRPYGLDFMENGDIVVADGVWPLSRLQFFNSGGLCLRCLGQGDILPFDVAVCRVGGEEKVAVTDHYERTVKLYDPQGKLYCSWGKDRFDWPNGIASHRNGQLVVADWSKGIISLHHTDGMLVKQFKCPNKTTMQSLPLYTATDKKGRIFVTDACDNRIKVFDESGNLLNVFGEGIKQIKDIVILPNENIVVSDWGTSSLRLYSPEGEDMGEMLGQQDGLRYPWGLAVNNKGHLLLGEQKINAEPSLKLFSLV